MSAAGAVFRTSFRRVRTAAVAWALVFGATIASSALTYASTYPTAAARRHVAAVTGADRGLAVLLGPIGEIGTVGGYTVYKCFVTLSCIGAIWGLLAATRLLRGEEDAGRWHLVVAGTVRPARATLAVLAGIGAAILVLVAGATAITLLAATDSRLAFPVTDVLAYGASLAIAPMTFVAVGAFVAQLAQTRRVANVLGMIVFGTTMVLRMIADAEPSTRWMQWLTPFGWIERMRPLTTADVRPFLLAALVVAALVAAATTLAARRDVGTGFVTASDRSETRSSGLRSVRAFLVRDHLGVVVAWLAGVGAGAFALGLVSEVADEALSRSSVDVLRRLGAASGTLVDAYFGVAFLLLAATVALVPAPQLTSATEDEVDGRLALVLAQPVSRRRLYSTRVLVALASVAAASLVAGVAAWAGAAARGVDAGLLPLVEAGLNLVPAAAVVLGAGFVALAWRPRAAAPVLYAVVVVSLVVSLLASLVTSTRWLERLSVFHYMALAPAQPVDGTAVVAMLAVAGALFLIGLVLFGRRDLAGT